MKKRTKKIIEQSKELRLVEYPIMYKKYYRVEGLARYLFFFKKWYPIGFSLNKPNKLYGNPTIATKTGGLKAYTSCLTGNCKEMWRDGIIKVF
jgi:hypothetical protein